MGVPLVGVIGGTGLGQALSQETVGDPLDVATPFGSTSGPIMLARWQGRKFAFLARHGPGHLLAPSQVPYRANIFAFKTIGVTHVIASGATGSLREEIRPRDLVIADQIIDKTCLRSNSFFDQGLAAHVEFAHPFCPELRRVLLDCADRVPVTVHDGGVYVCMEGPQFSTAAESRMHRSWGGDLIGMTCMPEAKLAREAELCYALVAMPTDYDCWRPTTPGKNPAELLEEIMHNLKTVTTHAIELIRSAIQRLDSGAVPDCSCGRALALGLWSDKSKVNTRGLSHLKPLLHKYLPFDA